MSGLDETDIRVLKAYAGTGNRELYWNYLANLSGNDGYALLALGVVRDDNAPGQVANRYAANYAAVQSSKHGSIFPDRPRVTEREWNSFGIDLLQADLKTRLEHLDDRRPDLALNLPVRDVQRSHDISFDQHGIDPNAWIPRILLEAARGKGGEAAAEEIWAAMLDNGLKGLERFGGTTRHIASHLQTAEGLAYSASLAKAYLATVPGGSNVDPDVVHHGRGVSSFHDPGRGKWYDSFALNDGPESILEVRDPRRIAELDDIRALRLEVQERRTRFHEEDPYREILASPRVIAGNDRDDAPSWMVAVLAPEAVDDLRSPLHAGHAEYRRAFERVSLFESQHGISPGPWSEQLAASLAVVARREGIDLERTWLQDEAGGPLQLDERPHYGARDGRLFSVDAATLSGIPVEQSSRAWAALQSPHYVSALPAAERTPEQAQVLQRLSPTDAEMFGRLRGALPGHIGDDHVLKGVLDARRGGIGNAGMIERVYLDGDQLRVHGLHGSLEARVDMSAPTPGCVESAQRLEDLERASVQAGMQAQERMYGQQVRGALQPPVMAL